MSQETTTLQTHPGPSLGRTNTRNVMTAAGKVRSWSRAFFSKTSASVVLNPGKKEKHKKQAMKNAYCWDSALSSFTKQQILTQICSFRHLGAVPVRPPARLNDRGSFFTITHYFTLKISNKSAATTNVIEHARK